MLLQALRTRDPDELAEGFSRWDLRARQVGGGPFWGELKALQLGGVRSFARPAIGVPGMYDLCERLRVSYTFGLSSNAALQRETEGLLAEAVAAEVVVRTRRIVVRLSSTWPHLDWYRRVCESLRVPLLPPVSHPSS